MVWVCGFVDLNWVIYSPAATASSPEEAGFCKEGYFKNHFYIGGKSLDVERMAILKKDYDVQLSKEKTSVNKELRLVRLRYKEKINNENRYG